jgi:hypothetical protein
MLWKPDGQDKVIGMTTLDNLRTRRRQLEDHLKQILGVEEREKVEGELMKTPIGCPRQVSQTRKPPYRLF